MNLKHTFLASAAALMAGLGLAADETVALNGLKPVDGVYTFDFMKNKKPVVVKCGQIFKIAKGNFITVSFEARSVGENNREFGKIQGGFAMFDSNRRVMRPSWVFTAENTSNELAAPLKKGDKVIKLKKPWKKVKYCCVAYSTRDDFSDLPNNHILSVLNEGETVPDGKMFAAKLERPSTIELNAGTGMRQHYWGNEWPNPFWPNIGNWKTYSFSIADYAKKGTSPKPENWWPGAEYGQIHFFISARNDFKVKVQIRNIKVKTIKADSGLF